MVKLLAESFGETKKGEWLTFIVSWDRAVARRKPLQTRIRRVKGSITVPIGSALVVTETRV